MIRIIKTTIFGCQTKAKGAMFFFSVFFGPWFSLGAFIFMKVRVPCGSEVSYAWMVNTRSRDGEIGWILILSLAISAISAGFLVLNFQTEIQTA